MSFITRSSARLARQMRTPLLPTQRQFTSSTIRSSTQGYGDGKGDPKAENPQDQPASNSTKEQAEHPGPKAPADSSAQSGGSRSKEAKETGSSPTGGHVGGKRSYSTLIRSRSFNTSSRCMASDDKTPSNGAKPKIMEQKEPGEDLSREEAKDVEQHNKEFDEKHAKANDGEDKGSGA